MSRHEPTALQATTIEPVLSFDKSSSRYLAGAGDWDDSNDSDGEQSEEEIRVAPSMPSMSAMAGASPLGASTLSTPGPSVVHARRSVAHQLVQQPMCTQVMKVHTTRESLSCSKLNFSPPPGSDDGGWCSPMQEEGPELTPSPSSSKGAGHAAQENAEVESLIQPTPAVRLMNRPAKLGIVDKVPAVGGVHGLLLQGLSPTRQSRCVQGRGLKSLPRGGITGSGGNGVSPLDSAGSLGAKSTGSLGAQSAGSLGSKSSLGSLSDLPSLGQCGTGAACVLKSRVRRRQRVR